MIPIVQKKNNYGTAVPKTLVLPFGKIQKAAQEKSC
jgi:hypothetical protein